MAGDFLRLGKPSPLLRGFSGWMEKGYERTVRERGERAAQLWKFWARGPNGELICGMVKESCDHHGRPYPLMIVGAGPVAESAEHWDLLPYACGETWAALASLGGPEISGVRELKERLAGIRSPAPGWEAFSRMRETETERLIGRDSRRRGSEFMDKMNNIEGLSRRDRFWVPLDVEGGGHGPTPASKLLRLLKSRSAAEPAMVFLGGGERVQGLLCLKRPLMLEDFATLWSAVGEAVA